MKSIRNIWKKMKAEDISRIVEKDLDKILEPLRVRRIEDIVERIDKRIHRSESLNSIHRCIWKAWE